MRSFMLAVVASLGFACLPRSASADSVRLSRAAPPGWVDTVPVQDTSWINRLFVSEKLQRASIEVHIMRSGFTPQIAAGLERIDEQEGCFPIVKFSEVRATDAFAYFTVLWPNKRYRYMAFRADPLHPEMLLVFYGYWWSENDAHARRDFFRIVSSASIETVP